MEFEMICDECKRKYHIVLKENEKIAKNATEERIDFEETELKENNVLSKCPYCNHENKYSISESNKNWYILYTTQIINCYPNTELKKVKELLEDIKKECYNGENIYIKKDIEELSEIKVTEILANKNNTFIKLEDFNKAIQEIKKSLE
jgi:hypothetical protein